MEMAEFSGTSGKDGEFSAILDELNARESFLNSGMLEFSGDSSQTRYACLQNLK